MFVPDFVVKYDPKTETPEDLTKKILYVLFIKRIKAKKPTITFIGADSGEGKSWSTLRLMELLFEIQGQDYSKYVDATNIYHPMQYGQKIKSLLFDKELKKANFVAIHEARDLVRAKLWHSFVAQAISDVNTQSRSIKRMGTFIISQFIRDITLDVRYTLNYYCTVSRPIGKKARLRIYKMWKDDRYVEKPILRKRKVRGTIVLPNGKYVMLRPDYLVMNRPSKDIIKSFEEQDLASKKNIIKNKLDKLIKEMEIEAEVGNNKVEAMVDFYIQNDQNLCLISKRKRNGERKIKKEIREMHDLTDNEATLFEEKLNLKLKEKGMIE